VKGKNIELPQDYKFYDINIMFDKFSKMLSELTNSFIILEFPDSRYIYVTRAVVSDLTNDFYQITLMTNLGLSITRTVEKYGFPSEKELEKILNEGLIGKSMHEIINIIKTKRIEGEQDFSYCHNANPLGKIALLTFKYSDYRRIYSVLNEYTSRLSKIISKNL